MERYPRGRRDVPAKDAVRETVARVQIPPSPPSETDKNTLSVFCFYELLLVKFYYKITLIKYLINNQRFKISLLNLFSLKT